MGLAEILNLAKDKKILIIGDLILDRYIHGKVNRISTEAPVPIVEVVNESFLLGGATNVANNIIALGGKASIAGVIGRDTAGRVLRELMKEKAINTEGVIEDERFTTVKTRIIAHNQHVVRFDRENKKKLDKRKTTHLINYIKKAIPEHTAVIISDYRKGVISSLIVKTIVRQTMENNAFIAVDPKVGHFHFYKNVSLITPNLVEASQGSGIEIKDEKSLLKAGMTLINRLSCRSVLITRGKEGMSLFKRDSSKGVKKIDIPTAAKKVFDVTGAGDTVIAAFTLFHAAGVSLEDAAIIANHAAGVVIGEVGTAIATPEAVLKSLSESAYPHA
ncbi:D-glycero-beta-D-manno-heptose-7-phosphate kinase [Thermodesulfovibrionales bacterium]|nr:D-glycero-beta-D-manno-heptose-7-phosphate kinase [Thermodesulfovibrionales bacterium]